MKLCTVSSWKTVSLLMLIIAAGMLLRRYVLCPVQVAGTSMEQTLQSGDITLSWRLPTTPQRGDIVECGFPGRSGRYIKRIIGLPGETIVFSKGALYINGAYVSEPYVSSATEDFSCTLGKDEYLVLGDNRMESYDSRAEDMGYIPADCLYGKIKWIFWPLDRFGPVY